MKIERQANKMINTPLVSFPNTNIKIKPKFNKNLIADAAAFPFDAAPSGKGQIIWKSLLGKSNEELLSASLIKAQKFAVLVKKTREEFKKNYNNLNKFPKMSVKDWE